MTSTVIGFSISGFLLVVLLVVLLVDSPNLPILLSILALGISVVSIVLNRHDRQMDLGLSVYDDFWFRTALFPDLYQEIGTLVIEFSNDFDERKDQVDLDNFNASIRRIRNHCYRFKILSPQFVTESLDLIDGLQNYVTFEVSIAKGQDLAEMEREDSELEIRDFQERMIKLLHSLHKKVSEGSL